MRFLIAEFKHESNCFSSAPTGLEDFRRAQVAFKGLGLHIRQALSAKISRFIHIDGVGVLLTGRRLLP